ncbi:hypothetical protein WA158_005760 [Blastocystis sp. Blastoise]
MTDTVLRYFNIRGRADIICLALELAGEKYIDKRHEREEWPAVKAASIADGSMPFGQCPALHIDGMDLVQSLAILRYIGRKHNLQGKTLQDIAFGDMLIDSFVDLQNAFNKIKYGNDTPEARKAFAETTYVTFMSALNKLFEKHTGCYYLLYLIIGKFFLGEEATIVDCVAFSTLSIMDKNFPEANTYEHLKQFMIDFAELKPIKEYLASGRRPQN